MKRRQFLIAMAVVLAPGGALAGPEVLDVYKSSSCGCCGEWVKHLRANGLQVRVHDVADPGEYRRRFGVSDALSSCHTAVVRDYTIEGHVPAREIKRLLAEKPRARGLAVPGMPIGSPGMEQPGQRERYEVLLFQADGRFRVYARY